jgi:hypothetical protein
LSKLNLGPYEIALIAGGFTIIGVLLGAWIGYRNALSLQSIVEFNKAAANFRSAFIKEQRLLAADSLADKTGLTASDIIKAAIDRHEIAMIGFKPFICKSEIINYENAWKDYAGESKHFEQYTTTRQIDIPVKKELALSRIENLLKFATHKH